MSNRNKCCIEIKLRKQTIQIWEVEPKQMLYWNELGIKVVSVLISSRTETNVVLKFSFNRYDIMKWLSRTETNVVLKLMTYNNQVS